MGIVRTFVLLTMFVGLLALPGAASAKTYYATAGLGAATSGECSSAAPCDLDFLMQILPAQDPAFPNTTLPNTVILNAGTYARDEELVIWQTVVFKGASGQAMPVILGDVDSVIGTESTVRVTSSSTQTKVQGIRVEQLAASSDALVVAAGPKVDRVHAITHAAGSIAIIVSNNSQLTSSVGHARGPNSWAVQALGTLDTGEDPPPLLTMRNVTAIADAANSVGLLVQSQQTCPAACVYRSIRVDARNVIARGTTDDVLVATAASGTAQDTALLDMSFSNFRPAEVRLHNVGATTDFSDGGNQSAEPTFVDRANGDFRQVDGSVTIDAGNHASVLAMSPMDLDEDARVIGIDLSTTSSTPNQIDIGADEATQAPDCFGDTASLITSSSARLRGRINAEGLDTNWWFEWGTTAAYGELSDSATSIGNATTLPKTHDLTGLVEGATYHFRVAAENDKGTCVGPDTTFVAVGPPVITTLAAKDLTYHSATMQANVNVGSSNGTAWFEWGPTSNYGNITPISSFGAVEVPLPGLAANTTYHYRIVAQNEMHQRWGSNVTFTTHSPPPAITAPAVADLTDIDATLRAHVNPHALETHLYWEWCEADGAPCDSSLDTTFGIVAGTSSTGITGLLPATAYRARMIAENSSGTTTGSWFDFTTAAARPTVDSGSASDVTDVAATVTGSVDGNGLATTWSVDYGTVSGALGSTTTTSSIAAPGAGAASIRLGSLAPDTTYYYRVRATNATATTLGDEESFTTTALRAPLATTAAASAITSTSARLNGLVTSGASVDVHFEHGTTAGLGTSTPIASVGAGSDTARFADLTGLTPSTTYHFTIAATNAAGSIVATPLTFTTLPPPPTVTGASVSTLSSTSLRIDTTIDTLGSNATWRVEYGTSAAYGAQSMPRALAGSGSPTSDSLTLTGLQAGATYHLRVAATSSSGTQRGSDIVGTTMAAATTLDASSVTPTSALLAADVSGTSAYTWSFEHAPSGAPMQASAETAASGAARVTVSLLGLTPSTTYTYRAAATNAAGRNVGATLTFTTPALPVAPTPDPAPPTVDPTPVPPVEPPPLPRRTQGTRLPDVFRGTALADLFRGLAGNDRLLGLGGNDRFYGGAGNDVADGGAGNDLLQGDAGNDVLTGGTGKDTLLGGTGSDTLNARDRKPGDVVNCGSGRDRATVDRGDRVIGCERVTRR